MMVRLSELKQLLAGDPTLALLSEGVFSRRVDKGGTEEHRGILGVFCFVFSLGFGMFNFCSDKSFILWHDCRV